MDELIGFGKPTDYATFVLRSKLSKRFGLFGKVPMWGGVRLHEYYPPLSTLLVRYFSMVGALSIYIAISFFIWTLNKGILTALLFLISYPSLMLLLYQGRFAELFGHTLVLFAFFTNNNILSGLFLGLAALSHPLPLIFGSMLLFNRLSFTPYLVAFLICGWWYIPFLIKRKKLAFLKDRRPDKVFGIYLSQWAFMVNVVLFLFSPLWISIVSVLWWLIPIYIDESFKIKINKEGWKFNLGVLKRKPLFLSDLIHKIPILSEIKENIAMTQRGGYLSTGNWIWASASYLLDKDIIVCNGLPATEIPEDKLDIPPEIKVVKIDLF